MSNFTYISLFSGIGAGELAIREILPNAKCIGYSEINIHALQIYKKHFPKHPELGDVTILNGTKFKNKHVDLIIGGSPCQGFSSIGERKNLDDTRSNLLLHFFRIIHEIKPRFFILENVRSMTQDIKSFITKKLGVEPILINSAHFTAQVRNRYYWCNFPVNSPTNICSISLKDILLPDSVVSKRKTVTTLKNTILNTIIPEKCKEPFAFTYYRPKDAIDTTFKSTRMRPRFDNKSNTVCAIINELQTVFDGKRARKLECIEAERLQGIPDNFTEGLGRTNRYKCIGNSFTIPVIKYLLLEMLQQSTMI